MPSKDALRIVERFELGELTEAEAVLKIVMLAADHEVSAVYEVLPDVLRKRLEGDVTDVDPARLRIVESVCTDDPDAYDADLKRRESLLCIGVARFQRFFEMREA